MKRVEFTKKGFSIFFLVIFGCATISAMFVYLIPEHDTFIIYSSSIVLGFFTGVLVTFLMKTETPELGRSLVKWVD